ncbi:unnamed protein product [Parajaminaea phylloscopi]
MSDPADASWPAVPVANAGTMTAAPHAAPSDVSTVRHRYHLPSLRRVEPRPGRTSAKRIVARPSTAPSQYDTDLPVSSEQSVANATRAHQLGARPLFGIAASREFVHSLSSPQGLRTPTPTALDSERHDHQAHLLAVPVCKAPSLIDLRVLDTASSSALLRRRRGRRYSSAVSDLSPSVDTRSPRLEDAQQTLTGSPTASTLPSPSVSSGDSPHSYLNSTPARSDVSPVSAPTTAISEEFPVTLVTTDETDCSEALDPAQLTAPPFDPTGLHEADLHLLDAVIFVHDAGNVTSLSDTIRGVFTDPCTTSAPSDSSSEYSADSPPAEAVGQELQQKQDPPASAAMTQPHVERASLELPLWPHSRSNTGSSGSSTEVDKTPQPSWSAAFPEPPERRDIYRLPPNGTDGLGIVGPSYTGVPADGLAATDKPTFRHARRYSIPVHQHGARTSRRGGSDVVNALGISTSTAGSSATSAPRREFAPWEASPKTTVDTDTDGDGSMDSSLDTSDTNNGQSFLPIVNPDAKLRDAEKRRRALESRESRRINSSGLMSFFDAHHERESDDLETTVAASLSQSFTDQRAHSAFDAHPGRARFGHRPASKTGFPGFTILLDQGADSRCSVIRRGSAPLPSLVTLANGEQSPELVDGPSDKDAAPFKDPHLLFDSPPDRSSMYFDAPVSPSMEELDTEYANNDGSCAVVDWHHFLDRGYPMDVIDGSKGHAVAVADFHRRMARPSSGNSAASLGTDTSAPSDLHLRRGPLPDQSAQPGLGDFSDDEISFEDGQHDDQGPLTRPPARPTGVDWLDDELAAEALADDVEASGSVASTHLHVTDPQENVARASHLPKDLQSHSLQEFDFARRAAETAFADALTTQGSLSSSANRYFNATATGSKGPSRKVGLHVALPEPQVILRRSPRSRGMPLSPPPSAGLPPLPESSVSPQNHFAGARLHGEGDLSLFAESGAGLDSQEASNSLGLIRGPSRPSVRRTASDVGAASYQIPLHQTSARRRPATTEDDRTSVASHFAMHAAGSPLDVPPNGRSAARPKKLKNRERTDGKNTTTVIAPRVTPRNASLGATTSGRPAEPTLLNASNADGPTSVDEEANRRRLHLMGESKRDSSQLVSPSTVELAFGSDERDSLAHSHYADLQSMSVRTSYGQAASAGRRSGLRDKISLLLSNGVTVGAGGSTRANQAFSRTSHRSSLASSLSGSSSSQHGSETCGAHRSSVSESLYDQRSHSTTGELTWTEAAKLGRLRSSSQTTSSLGHDAEEISIASGTSNLDERSIPVYPPSSAGSLGQIRNAFGKLRADRTQSVLSTKTTSSFGIPSNVSVVSASTGSHAGQRPVDPEAAVLAPASVGSNRSASGQDYPSRKSFDSEDSFPLTVSAKSTLSGSGQSRGSRGRLGNRDRSHSQVLSYNSELSSTSQRSGGQVSRDAAAHHPSSRPQSGQSATSEQRFGSLRRSSSAGFGGSKVSLRASMREMTEAGKIREQRIVESITLDKAPSPRVQQKAGKVGFAVEDPAKTHRAGQRRVHSNANLREVDHGQQGGNFLAEAMRNASVGSHKSGGRKSFSLSRPSMSSLSRPNLAGLPLSMSTDNDQGRTTAPAHQTSPTHAKGTTTRPPPSSFGRSGRLAERMAAALESASSPRSPLRRLQALRRDETADIPADKPSDKESWDAQQDDELSDDGFGVVPSYGRNASAPAGRRYASVDLLGSQRPQVRDLMAEPTPQGSAPRDWASKWLRKKSQSKLTG